MSVQSIQTSITQIQRELSLLRQKSVGEGKNEASKKDRILQLKQSINRASSQFTVESAQREIARLEQDIVGILRKKNDLDNQVNTKTKRLHEQEQQLFREQERERRK